MLILSPVAQRYFEVIRRYHLPGLSVVVAKDVAEARRWLDNCNIVFGRPDLIRLILPDLKRLEWVQSTYAGVRALLDPASRQDYLLTNLGALYGPVMTEYVFCHLLMHERRALERYHAQRRSVWDSTVPGTLRGKLMGLMGVGKIGSRIAQTAKHLGLRTRGYTRISSGCEFIDAYCHGEEWLLPFAEGLDYVVCTLPDTPETKGLIDAAFLEALPSRAVLLNIGRGGVVDEAALVEALEGGSIAKAVLDVVQEEPLPASHPLWTTPNLHLTFHTAAPDSDYPAQLVAIFLQNYQRFVHGWPLEHRVSFGGAY